MTDVPSRLADALEGRYRLEREIGAGGMATVYLAEDLKHHRAVAVKVLRPEIAAAMGSERFLREIEIAAGLTHPHILPLHDSGEADGFLFYVMPYIEGESLRARLDREKQLPVGESLEIARQIAVALEAAHQRGVVHRDIKPENILLSAGEAVVADFGIARAISEAGGLRLTETGIAVGTPSYMSPEQASGSEEVEPRSDVYALGCVLHEMLAGQAPFTGPSAESVIRQHMSAPPPSVEALRPGVAPELRDTVRRALAKAPADRFKSAAQFAETLSALAGHGEGSRLTHGMSTDVAARPPRGRMLALGAAAVAIVVVAALWIFGIEPGGGPGAGRIRTLAVLPLENFSDAEQEYFADGMTEQLITELAQIESLTVISRTSVMRYKGGERPPIPDIARALGVEGVIEGSVLRAENRVRINVQLIEAATDRHLWAESYEGDLTDVLSLQDEVARAITEQIRLALTPEQEARFVDARSVDPAAHEAYLRGRLQYERRTPASLERAIDFFSSAIGIDSTYALAYAGLANALSMAGAYPVAPSQDAIPRARAAARRALALDSTSGDAYATLAWSAAQERDWADADDAFREALRLHPGSVDANQWYGWFLAGLGREAQATRQFERALQLDPQSLVVNASVGWNLMVQRSYDAAIAQLRQTIAMDPTFPRAYYWLGQALGKIGAHDEAIEAVQAAVRQSGGSSDYVAGLAHAYGIAGRDDAARRILADLLRPEADRFVTSVDMAVAHVGLAMYDDAVQWLERAYDEKEFWLVLIRVDPRFDPMRSHPGFEALLTRIDFPR